MTDASDTESNQSRSDTDRAVQRECLLGPDISGSYHHYGHLTWWDPGEWLGDYRRPECPVTQLGSVDEKAECTLIAERITDEDGRGAWHCGWHGTFRVFGYPRHTEIEMEQQPLVADGGRAQSEGEIYRIECQECGAIEHGDPEDDVEWDKRYHRMHHCPGAEFEVSDGS